ncbi:RsiV family protein [Chryseobacterium pennipullorum]|uniref:DUF3298 domain-containing protein n=1 Tax=Chryseobacterium pennipullorum TaxID=2258963 RepID=A0A3D9AYU5_9FLAO|nr:RsiV family protein [Chryseobacterium pennipullorum]REC46491.1 DUF3298 domain-containing protein [Chryseobacterium pennipullorum]
MKNTIAVLALSSLFAFSACTKKESKTEDSQEIKTSEKADAKPISVDSVRINDTLKANKLLSVSFSSKLLVFPEIRDKKLLDSIYFNKKGITDYSKTGLESFLRKEKAEFFKGSKDWNANRDSATEWFSDYTMNLKYSINDFIHIEYSESSYYGGAHGSYDYFERVFDLKNNKKVTLADITTISKKNLETLLMKNVDKIPSGAAESEGKNSDMLLVKQIPTDADFYFDDHHLYFRYNPYAIASYAAGAIIIPVSWEDLKGTLKPEFKERMKIK